MFEKASPLAAARSPGHRPPPARRAGEALRALAWSELTARLNAARDLRLLLRSEREAPIEPVAASFGDAAARYFALIADGERAINPDALGQSKILDAMIAASDANRPGPEAGAMPDAVGGDARDVQ